MSKLSEIFFKDELKKFRVSKVKYSYPDMAAVQMLRQAEQIIRNSVKEIIGKTVTNEYIKAFEQVTTEALASLQIPNDFLNTSTSTYASANLSLQPMEFENFARLISAGLTTQQEQATYFGIDFGNEVNISTPSQVVDISTKTVKQQQQQQITRLSKFSSIFFDENVKKIRNLLRNVQIKRYFYEDLKKYKFSTLVIDTNGNVGIGYAPYASTFNISL